MSFHRRSVLGAVLALAASEFSSAAWAQAYPSKPIRCIVPYAAGGNVDVTARLISEPMTKNLGQSVVVETRAGAGGLIGAEATLALPADGYTFVLGAFGTFHVSPLLAGKPSLLLQLAPVGLLSSVPTVIVAPPNGRFRDWPSVLEALRDRPGSVSVGHAGNGTTNHIGILRIQAAEKVAFNVVAYRGSGQGLNDVLAGQIDLYVDQLSSSLPLIRAGKLLPLVTLSLERVPELKDVPTLKEVGGPAFDGGTTLGAFVRSETPKPVITTLNGAVVAALNDAMVKQRLNELGVTVMPSTAEEFAAHLKAEERDTEDLARLGLLKSQ